MTAFLELRHVTKVFSRGLWRKKRTVALEDISFAISTEPPEVKVVAGESGSGKTTLGLILMGFLSPTGGEVLYQGKDVHRLTRSERRQFRREVQAVFQDPFSVYNPFYKVDHVLSTPIAKFKLAKSQTAARALMEEALVGVGLRPEETLGQYPHQLSGGQRQRVMVARALLMKPRLIIADEPVSMVDASLRATILESLRKLNQDFGISILYITHDLTTAYHIGHDILVLYRGSVAEAGEAARVIKNPQHPYTQLLINSIPWPDIKRKWNLARSEAVKEGVTLTTNQGCKFADRCPHRMPVCAEKLPPLFQTGDRHAVSCYLYQDSGIIELSRKAA